MEEHLEFLAPPDFRVGPTGALPLRGEKAEGSKTESPIAETQFPSDGHGLKEICQLFSMVLIGWVTAVPHLPTCPWHCAFPLVTVKSRSHWTQRPESRTISPSSS